MSDKKVLQAQQWVNVTYKNVTGFTPAPEDGKPGLSTAYALTRALQHELGITALADNFGPTTLSTLTAKYPLVKGLPSIPANVIKIVQAALYCSGYDGSDLSGTFDAATSSSVLKLQGDMGVTALYNEAGVSPKMLKGLLTMDSYVEVSGGNDQVRAVQQWLNGAYLSHSTFYVIACDGVYSRNIQRALLTALQYEVGISDDNATGHFGPTTQAGMKKQVLTVGSTGVFVRFFSAALVGNHRLGAKFTNTFDAAVSVVVSAFQQFVKLPITGQGDYQTWASLLVSTGDATRSGTALDTVGPVTAAKASALVAAGYTTVGRYLTNVSASSLNKKIQPGELEVIRAAGLSVFPIYETFGSSVDYFQASQGGSDALSALEAARGYGFKAGTRIYFAVDFDALDADVTSNIIPHFKSIKDTLDRHNSEYEIGVYGPRNVCSRLAKAGLTTASFLADMSTGYSGNQGFPMPRDWAFDQISTITTGTGDGELAIDNNVASGLDRGQNSFNMVTCNEEVPDVQFDMADQDALLADVRAYLESISIPENQKPALPNSTTDALAMLLRQDAMITSLARSFQMRKSLIQSPILWEIRNRTIAEVQAKGNSVNAKPVPPALIAAAKDINVAAPGLNSSEKDTQLILARYNGTGNDAEKYGQQTLGLYKVFEKYNAATRNIQGA